MTINDIIVYTYILLCHLLSYVIHLLFYIRVYYYSCDSWDGNHDVYDEYFDDDDGGYDNDDYGYDDYDNNNGGESDGVPWALIVITMSTKFRRWFFACNCNKTQWLYAHLTDQSIP